MLTKSSLMIFTAVLSNLFTKKKLYKHHVIAMVILVIGLTLVGILSSVYDETKIIENDTIVHAGKAKPSHVFYIFVNLLGQFFEACQFVTEAVFNEGYALDPTYMVGMEGLFSCLYFFTMIPFFIQIK